MRSIEKNDLKRQLSNKIKKLRLEKGLTQEELASKINYKDKQVINRYEVEGANPTAYNIYLLCKALEISFDDLFDFLNE